MRTDLASLAARSWHDVSVTASRRSPGVHGLLLVFAWLALTGWSPGEARANDAEIISIIGRGDARETAEAEWRAATVKQKLTAGAFVRTHELSQMALLLRDTTQIRLHQL